MISLSGFTFWNSFQYLRNINWEVPLLTKSTKLFIAEYLAVANIQYSGIFVCSSTHNKDLIMSAHYDHLQTKLSGDRPDQS